MPDDYPILCGNDGCNMLPDNYAVCPAHADALKHGGASAGRLVALPFLKAKLSDTQRRMRPAIGQLEVTR